MSNTNPELLWHYTDANGLFGIINSNRLRFTDARFLNDRTERVYGATLLAEALKDEAQSGDPLGLIRGIQLMQESYMLPSRQFVCSMSGTNESISQWQRYAAGGNGYSLGFKVSELDRILGEHAVRYQMQYDSAKQRQSLAKLIKLEHDRFKNGTVPGAEAHYVDVAWSGGVLEHAVLEMKHPLFSEEQEWRYVVNIDPDAYQLERLSETCCVRDYYIKSYVELPLSKASADPQRLPITHIVCGPKLDPQLAITTVTHFLNLSGYSSVTVVQSELAAVWR